MKTAIEILPSTVRPVEDRRFFLTQYMKTLPFNILSIGMKFLNAAAWTMLNNPALLGYYSLAGAPSSINQQGQLAGSLVQAILPNSPSTREDRALVSTAFFVDFVLVGIIGLATFGFFMLSHAPIIDNLGMPVLCGIILISLLEPLSGIMIPICNAKRKYLWNFLISNVRIMVLLCLLTLLYASRKTTPQWGILLWVFCAVSGFGLAAGYLWNQSLLPHWRDFSMPGSREFMRNILQNSGPLIFMRLSWLLSASLPSLFLAYIHNTTDIGQFSFALTLSGFLYASIAPLNEQVYAPTVSRLIYQRQPKILFRRLFQMILIGGALSFVISAGLVLWGKDVLVFIHKLAFLDSFKFLPALLTFQTLRLMGWAYSNSLFCMNRFKALGTIHIVASMGGLSWYLFFRHYLVYGIWGLPLFSLLFISLGFAYHAYLIHFGKTLLRRSLYTFTARKTGCESSI